MLNSSVCCISVSAEFSLSKRPIRIVSIFWPSLSKVELLIL